MRLLATTAALAVCSVLSLGAVQGKAEGQISSKSPNGETYTVEFYGDLVPGPDKRQTLMQGRGEYWLESRKLLVTSGPINDLAGPVVRVNVSTKAPGTGLIAFVIGVKTTMCRDGKPATSDTFKKGEMITVVTRLGEKTALSIRSGPMLFSGMGTAAQLRSFECP